MYLDDVVGIGLKVVDGSVLLEKDVVVLNQTHQLGLVTGKVTQLVHLVVFLDLVLLGAGTFAMAGLDVVWKVVVDWTDRLFGRFRGLFTFLLYMQIICIVLFF